MRSERVFGAMAHVPNRFLLTKLVAAATRKFHRPNTRIQETMDDVLVRFSQAYPMSEAEQHPNVRLLRSAEKVESQTRDVRPSEAAA